MRDRNLPSHNPVAVSGKVKGYKGFFTLGVDSMFDETIVTYGENRDRRFYATENYDLGRTCKTGG